METTIDPAYHEQEIGWRDVRLSRHASEITELNHRLIERQESFQTQLARIEETWREKLREKDAQIVALREALEECGFRAERIQRIKWGHDGDCGANFDASAIEEAAGKALSTPPPPVVALEEVRPLVDTYYQLQMSGNSDEDHKIIQEFFERVEALLLKRPALTSARQ